MVVPGVFNAGEPGSAAGAGIAGANGRRDQSAESELTFVLVFTGSLVGVLLFGGLFLRWAFGKDEALEGAGRDIEQGTNLPQRRN